MTISIDKLIAGAGGVKELSKVLGVTTRSIYRWKEANHIPEYAMWRIQESEYKQTKKG